MVEVSKKWARPTNWWRERGLSGHKTGPIKNCSKIKGLVVTDEKSQITKKSVYE